jgi:uncharacterized protein with NRDE domain
VFAESVSADLVESCLLLEFPWVPFCKKHEFNLVGVIGLHKMGHFRMLLRERGVEFEDRVEWKSGGGFRGWFVRSEKGDMSKWVAMEMVRRGSFCGFNKSHS